MRLSTKARYGLRAMLALALSEHGASGKAIAESQGLPAAYLEQLMGRLRNGMLVQAQRGVRGKYVLAREAETINLAEIIEALEGPIDIADCATVPNCCYDRDACALREVFAGANAALHDYLARVTLAELAQRQRQIRGGNEGMYYI
jgi:Rrf2 family protein